MYNEVSKKATNKYIKEKRDRLSICFPKGDKEKFRTHAASKGMSLNKLIIELLNEDIEKSKREE